MKTGEGVIRESDGACIPDDLCNKDYREYREWLDEGNEPAPYIEPSINLKKIACADIDAKANDLIEWGGLSENEKTAIDAERVRAKADIKNVADTPNAKAEIDAIVSAIAWLTD